MSSTPDLHDEQVVSAPAGPVAPADVLARVKADGLRRRTRRHRRNGVLAALGIALLAVPAVALLPGDGGRDDLTVAADGDGDGAAPATTVDRRPVTTVTTIGELASPTSVVTVPDPAEPPATTVPGRGPATTVVQAPTCRNSTDPACGAFRWDPQPANQPATVTVTVSNPTPVVGEEVVFTVTWSDPDAPAVRTRSSHFGDSDVGLASPQLCENQDRHGAWTPPPPRAGSGQYTVSHVYEAPGTYGADMTVVTGASDGSTDCQFPYESVATGSTTVTVTAASA